MIHWTQDGEKIEIPRAEAAQEGQLCELGGNIIFIGLLVTKLDLSFFLFMTPSLLCQQVSNNLHEVKIMRRYCIQKREDYTLYNKLSREIRYLFWLSNSLTN